MYKYWLLNHLDLIEDVKGIIRYYAKRRMITPPNYDILKKSHSNIYIHDDIVYHLTDIELFFNTPHIYTQCVFFVENKRISEIQFTYFIEDTLLDSDCNVDCSTLQHIHLYSYDNLTLLNDAWEYVEVNNIEDDGCYSIMGNVTFIVE